MFKKLSWRYLVLKIFFKISFLKKKNCDFYSTRVVDHFDTKQVIICDKISILDFAYVSYLKSLCRGRAEPKRFKKRLICWCCRDQNRRQQKNLNTLGLMNKNAQLQQHEISG